MLVSPSASPPNAEDWFDQFFEFCDALGCRVDYIGQCLMMSHTLPFSSFVFMDVVATHSYSGRADYDINYLNNIYKRYGKKIWFTEFALPSTMNQQDEMEYMQVNDMNTMKRFKLSSLSRPSCLTWSRVRPSGGTPGSCTGGRWTDLVKDGIWTESSLSWRTSRRH